MGILVWGPLGQGMLTGRVRRGQDTDVRRAKMMNAFSDERRLDTVERLILLAEEAGLSMPHLAMAFAILHPGVTSALLSVRTVEQLDDLLAEVDVVLSDAVLDRIDEIVAPGTDIGTLDQAYVPLRSRERNCAADRSANALPPETGAVAIADVGGVNPQCGLPLEDRPGRRVHDRVVLGEDRFQSGQPAGKLVESVALTVRRLEPVDEYNGGHVHS